MLDAALCMKITGANSKCILLINITRFVDIKMTSFFQHGKLKLQEAKTSRRRKRIQC